VYFVVWDLRPYPFLGWVDDYRYVKSAWHIRQFEWLGPFESSTLVKRPVFSVFLALVSTFHLPFVQFQILFYVAATAFFVYSLLRLGLPRLAGAAVLAVLSFTPTVYDANGSRILRETVTIGLELLVFGLLFWMLIVPQGTRALNFLKSRSGFGLYILYVLMALHWGMRE
jgi:hypothetical protein